MPPFQPPDLPLPTPPEPIGSYERGMILNGIGVVSGQFPIVDGALAFRGRLGSELTTEEGRAAAEVAAVNALAQIEQLIAKDWMRFAGLLRLEGYLACAPGFSDAAVVLDGASSTFLRYLGERGRHARAIAMVNELPMASPLELVVTFAMTPS